MRLTPALILASLVLAACERAPALPAQGADASPGPIAICDTSDRAKLGLMSSLPLYWPLGADIATIAGGGSEHVWQREVIEQCFEITPLDTLSPIAGLSPDQPETDPLEGLERLAVIQPRGLSPADNVALDEWVRGGGRLLLVLDPMLTGDYDIALGDPGRPVDSAPIPPVVKRWGLAMSVAIHEVFEDGIYDVPLGGRDLTVSHPGTLRIIDREAGQCEILARESAARCEIGKGRVTLLADAAVFEHIEAAEQRGASLQSLLAFAFD